jgi:AraC-like DNA-binding protein
MKGFAQLLAVARQLKFEAHEIGHLLDKSGRYEEQLDREFPFMIRLFVFRADNFTPGLTWHERLELFIPVDGDCALRMGDRVVELSGGDVLIVDNLKLHRTVDDPKLNTRVIVISFLPEFVYSLGSPLHDYTFLLPFYSKVEDHPHVLRRSESLAEPAFDALARLLECYFDSERGRYRQAGCKAYFLELLYLLAWHFRSTEVLKSEFMVQQALSLRLKEVFEFIRHRYSERITLAEAAALARLSKPQLTRIFKKVAGMSFVQYVNHVRLSHGARMLKETRQSVAEIASALGFSDQSYFDRQFRKSFGQSPREFRSMGVEIANRQ